MLYVFFWVIPRRLNLDAEELPRRKHTTVTELPRRKYNNLIIQKKAGTAVAQWLRCCVTNRKEAGSIPAGVSEFFI